MRPGHTRPRKALFFKLLGPTLLLLLPLLLLGGSLAEAGLSPQSAEQATGDQALPSRLVVRVYFRNTAERDSLATELDALEVPTTGGYLTVVSDQTGVDLLRLRGLRVEIDAEQTASMNATVKFGNTPDNFFGGYKTVEEMQTFLDAEVAAHPTLAEKVDYRRLVVQGPPRPVHPARRHTTATTCWRCTSPTRPSPAPSRSSGWKPVSTPARSPRPRSRCAISASCSTTTTAMPTPTGWWTSTTSGSSRCSTPTGTTSSKQAAAATAPTTSARTPTTPTAAPPGRPASATSSAPTTTATSPSCGTAAAAPAAPLLRRPITARRPTRSPRRRRLSTRYAA